MLSIPDSNPEIEETIMAKKQTANDTQDVNETVPEVLRDKLITGAVYTKIVDAAKEALTGYSVGQKEIDTLQTQIQLKRQGNSQKVFALARFCVEQTMHKGKADLRKAGIVMRDACEAAEADTMAQWNKSHPGQVVKHIRQVVASWPPLKTYVVQSMLKAGLDPRDFENASKLKEAYAKHLEAHPETADARGARPRATDTNTANSRDGKVITGHVENIDATPRHQIALLVKAVEALPTAELQKESAALIAKCIAEIGALKVKDEGTERRAPAPRNPARESGTTGAQAE